MKKRRHYFTTLSRHFGTYMLILIITLFFGACEKYYEVPKVNQPDLKNGDIRFFKSETGNIDTLLITCISDYRISDKTYFFQEIHYRYELLKNNLPDSLVFSFDLNSSGSIFQNWERLENYTLRDNRKLNHTFYNNRMYYQLKYGLIKYTSLNGHSYELLF